MEIKAIYHVGFGRDSIVNCLSPTLSVDYYSFSISQERQHLEHCLLHALNNLFQDRCFSPNDLDGIANSLAPGVMLPFLHPHRTLLGTWDVNVLECALGHKERNLKWYDVRDVTFASLDTQACLGLIVNVRAGGGPLNFVFRGRRHWFALRCISGTWFNLDSKLREPQPIVSGDESPTGMTDTGSAGSSALRVFLSKLVENSDAKVFIIT